MKRSRNVFSCALLGLTAWAGSVSPVQAQSAAPLRLQIGVLTSLTGSMAAPGVFQMNGFRLAVEEVNASGGLAVAGVLIRLS